MAIQMRRGAYINFNKAKLLPGEWAVVLSDDQNANDGKSVYICFAAGNVKRMATYEDMLDNVRNAIETENEEIIASITDAVNGTNDRVTKAENDRTVAENSRVDNEKARAAAEQSRIYAEQERAAADERRETRQLKNDSDQAQNNAAAKGLTYRVCSVDEYRLDGIDGMHNVPAIDGKTGVMYLTPKVSGATDEDAYDQWMYIDSKWELMGGTSSHIDPTTTNDIDSIVSDSQVTADRYLNSTGLTYFWAKAKQRLTSLFAPKSHGHDVGDITGTLPIENGGTGASTASDALLSIGAASSADLATLRDSVYQDTGKVYLYNNPTWGCISYRAKGGVCTLTIAGVGGIAANGSWTVPGTIPRKFMIDENIYAPLCHRQTGHQAQIWIPGKNYENGNLIIYSALDTTSTSTRISGILSWVY